MSTYSLPRLTRPCPAAAPVVYTSYDYSAPLRETRQQGNKMFQTKLVNMFANSSPDLLKTIMVGNGTGYKVSCQAPLVILALISLDVL